MTTKTTVTDPAGESLTTARSLRALRRDLPHATDALAATLATCYSTWDALAAAGPADRGRRAGPAAAQVTVSAIPALHPADPVGCRAVGRFDAAYPDGLAVLGPDTPVVVWLRGELPAGPLLGVGGAEYPSPPALVRTRAAVRIAARQRVAVVATTDGIGGVALAAAVAAGGVAVAVVAVNPAFAGPHTALLAAVVAGGGAVISTGAPGVPATAGRNWCGRVVAAMATAVVVPEAHHLGTGGHGLVSTAIAAERVIIVPEDRDHLSPLGIGTGTLASAKRFGPGLFGSSTKVAARLAAGLPAADVVAGTEDVLTAAIGRLAVSARPATSRRAARRPQRRGLVGDRRHLVPLAAA